jgi:hypothetical protein
MVDYTVRPNDEWFVDQCSTPLLEDQAAYYLNQGWKELFGSAPSLKSLAILWAQSALETGRWKYLRNNNWGNIKKRDGIKYTSYECSEVINGVNINFKSYHPETFFAAWDTPLDGAKGYLKFISEKSRYKPAWIKLQAGDPVGYVYALKSGGYFTAPVDSYLKTVMSLYNYFLSKASVLLSWSPPKPIDIVPEPIPDPTPEPEPVVPVIPDPEPIIKPAKSSDFFTIIINLIRSLFSIKQ